MCVCVSGDYPNIQSVCARVTIYIITHMSACQFESIKRKSNSENKGKNEQEENGCKMCVELCDLMRRRAPVPQHHAATGPKPNRHRAGLRTHISHSLKVNTCSL